MDEKRTEFMKWAIDEIERILLSNKNRIMDVVEQAYTAGKKDGASDEFTKDLAKLVVDSWTNNSNYEVQKITDITWPPTTKEFPKNVVIDDIPEGCKHCSNHPINGGSGICHCIIGAPKITC